MNGSFVCWILVLLRLLFFFVCCFVVLVCVGVFDVLGGWGN